MVKKENRPSKQLSNEISGIEQATNSTEIHKRTDNEVTAEKTRMQIGGGGGMCALYNYNMI